MNRFRALAIATILIFVTAAAAQEMSGEHASLPTAETQLKFLSSKLDLTSAQQEKIKPVLQELHAATVKLVQNEGLSNDERMSRIRDSHYAADRKIRTILTDDQRAKLDQVEKEPHPELHGSVSSMHN